ncbi:RNA 2',3'-cyclic phosphodiesterase [Sediminibacillus dalangtanensis]|uniref:RNA 2',3'-cyclic phosphodiesterase n=1 Tax=Sediminibacillus dalangtanensis TaxID=2729421 RepID=A0ABX7VT44_9BACI|nr:RNA 2',3'-cyclic phosphodiesterase [Sediminibacillus dalangtanensis]QTN00128.1 RNA 2',3'-cyclic phosphodiesterase [Sediminibacillus dalangtanensis]
MADSHYFLGIPLDERIQQQLVLVQEKLRRHPDLAYKNWTHPQDMHITLKFLGPSADSTIKELTNSLQQFSQKDCFSLEVKGIGFFGNPQKPRVVWAGVEKTSPLAALQKQVDALCQTFGWSPEYRPYRPHITLAKKWAGTKKVNAPITEELALGNLEVERIHLYQIHPSQTPKYKAIEIVSLK